jgi:hypothetical protein
VLAHFDTRGSYARHGVRAEAVSQWPQARAGDQPHARYTVTATSTWIVIWPVRGMETSERETRTSTVVVAVGEA